MPFKKTVLITKCSVPALDLRVSLVSWVNFFVFRLLLLQLMSEQQLEFFLLEQLLLIKLRQDMAPIMMMTSNCGKD